MVCQTKPLSSTQIAKAKDKLYRLYDGNGLVINIAPNGGKYWYLQYKHPITTKSLMYKLGDYPVLSLADIRIVCQDCHKLLSQNIDPKTYFELERQKQENALKNDFKSVFREWLETKNYSPKTQEKMQNYQDELLAVIGNKVVSDITVPDLMLVLKLIEKAGHFAKLEKVRSLINQTLTYAVATGRSDTNPAINPKGAFKTGEVRHNPAILDERRLGDLVQAIDGYHGYFVMRQALLFALLMFARLGEVRNMTWEQVDWNSGTWTYTPNKTKKSTGVQIVSPLPIQAIEILRQMKEYRPHSELVFPSAITQACPHGASYRGMVICRSMDNPTSIVSFKIGHALVDELDTLPTDKARDACRKIIARMRYNVPNLRNGIDLTTTPEGFKFTYEQFVKEAGSSTQKAKLYGLIQASTYDNEANLPLDYIESLRQSYPPQLIGVVYVLKGEKR